MSLSRNHRKLYEQVVDELGLRIVGGRYAIGDTLPNEETLCNELGVSRTVLREATKVLTDKGLIQPLPKIGTQVQPRSTWKMVDAAILRWDYEVGNREEFLFNLTEVRRIFEPEAARLAAQRANADEIVALDQAYQLMAANVDNPEGYLQGDVTFHEILTAASHNALLAQLTSAIRLPLMVSHQISATVPGGRATALPYHHTILDAIQCHHPDRAYQAMVALINQTWEDIQQALPIQPPSLTSVMAMNGSH